MSLTIGSPCVWQDIEDELAPVRAQFLPLAVADIPDNTIQREALVRPLVSGFPNTGFESANEQLRWRQFGLFNPDAVQRGEWGRRRERIIIQPATLRADERWRTPLGFSVFLPREAEVGIVITLDFQVRFLSTSGTPESYPTGAGGGEVAGYFTILSKSRAFLDETDHQPSRLYVYPMDYVGSPADVTLNDGGQLEFSDSFARGTWDFQLAWVKQNAPGNLVQIDVSRATLKLKAHT